MSLVDNIEIKPPRGAYFITQTLKPAYYGISARRQIAETRNIFKKIMIRYVLKYYFVIEITNAGNVHYHGWFTIPDGEGLIKLCMIDDLKILGNTKIDIIRDTEIDIKRVEQYLLKDLEETYKILNCIRAGPNKGKTKSQIVKISFYGLGHGLNHVPIFHEPVNTVSLDEFFDDIDTVGNRAMQSIARP